MFAMFVAVPPSEFTYEKSLVGLRQTELYTNTIKVLVLEETCGLLRSYLVDTLM
jgi:hypothetical protein